MPIRISLVFPLSEERGCTAEALAAWTRQTFSGDRHEIIVVADDRNALDPKLGKLLRAHDRILRGEFANLAHQFDAGMRGNRRLLVLDRIALHAGARLPQGDGSIPHRELPLAGACCESIPAWENAYQFIDATTFEEGYRLFLRPTIGASSAFTGWHCARCIPRGRWNAAPVRALRGNAARRGTARHRP